MSWPRVRLDEITEINPRLASVLGDEEDISFMGMADVSELGVTNMGVTRSYSEVKKGYTAFANGDLLFAKITPCFENGKIAQAQLNHQIGFGSTEFHVVRAQSEVVEPRYLLHLLRGPEVRVAGKRRMTGSGGQQRVPADFLKSVEVPLPPLPEQRRIAAILDQADELRTKRRHALTLLDELADSLFIDMFGDPAWNKRDWPVLSIGSLAVKYSDGPFGSNLKSSDYTTEGVRVIRLQNIGVGKFKDRDHAFISEEHFEKLCKHECLPGDVVIGTLGDPNLRACLIPESIDRAINKADCVQFRPDPKKVSSRFIVGLLNQNSVERMAQSLVMGQTRARISMGRLRGLMVPVPPIGLQNEFSKNIVDIERIKEVQRRATFESDELFASLQHRAFRGEL